MDTLGLPALGTDASEFLADRNLILRHGTSLQLMALVGTCLNDSEEFAQVDPSADWKKWQERRPDFSLYYAALINPALDGANSVLCVLRAVLDGVPKPVAPHRSRLVIDYVTTRPAARGQGLATMLVDFVVETSRLFGANTYVLATEDACVYWMGRQFVLEDGACLKARLNIFPDTHLLRRAGDAMDTGCEADLELAMEEESEDDSAEATSEEGQEDAHAEEAVANGNAGDEDMELQTAIALSLSESPGAQGEPPRT